MLMREGPDMARKGHTESKPKATDAPVDIEAIHRRIELLKSKLHAIKIAFLNRTEIDERIPEYEDVSAVARQLIHENYDLQKALHGKVLIKLTVPKVLRGSNR